MNDLPQLKVAILDFVTTVHDLYAHYLDSNARFEAHALQIEQAQQVALSSLPPGTNRDSLRFSYGHGDPNNPDNRILHETTQGEYKRRNARGGPNQMRAAQLLLVLIFEYWESEHRKKIAAALGLPNQDDLQIPILGDIRLLRHDVIHHRSVIKEETVHRLTEIQGLTADTELALDGRKVESLVRSVKAAMDDLVVSNGGADPEHRKIWHLQ